METQIWIRLGGFVSVDESQKNAILSGDKEALLAAIKNGFTLTGESYIPGEQSGNPLPEDVNFDFDPTPLILSHFEENLSILEENDINITSKDPVWEDKPHSVELEAYTDAGEDMIICLEEPTRKCLEEYINEFDIDEKVMLWWQSGRDAAKKKGVPFDNIRDHYNDYEAFLNDLRTVAKLLS